MILILKSMTCRHPTVCSDCGEPIQRGAKIGYAHDPHLVICAPCFSIRQPGMRRYHGGLYVSQDNAPSTKCQHGQVLNK